MTEIPKNVNFFLPKEMMVLAQRQAAEHGKGSPNLLAKAVFQLFLQGDLVTKAENADVQALGTNTAKLTERIGLLEQQIKSLVEAQSVGVASLKKQMNDSASDSHEQSRVVTRMLADVQTKTTAIWQDVHGDDVNYVAERDAENKLNRSAHQNTVFSRRAGDVPVTGE